MAVPPDRPSPVPPGTIIRQYRIVDEIGRGGMGVVYRAIDERLGRVVAMKCPWPEHEVADDGTRRMERFRRETKIQSSFHQPNIIRLIDAFHEGPTPWLVMEYVEGTSLADELVRQGHLPPGAVLRYARHLTAALEHAHSRNVLHRDIKPSNVLISRDDVAYLMDFGLARFIRPEKILDDTTTTAFQTSVHVQLGTTSYMSPEQVKAEELDERSDVFSLGALLYEMCTGFPPFPGDSRADIEHRIKHEAPTPMARFSYDIPEGLERIVLRCLSKDPGMRYQGMRDLGAAFRRESRLHDISEISRDNPELIREVTGQPARRRDRWPYLLTGLSLVVAVFAVFAARRAPPRPPIPLQVTTGSHIEQGPSLSPDGGRIAYTASVDGNLDIHVSDVRGGKPLRITTDPASDRDVCWSPDGSSLYFSSDRAGRDGIWKTGAFGGTPTLVLEGGVQPAISPDGKWIAFATPGPEGDLLVAKAPLDDPGNRIALSDPASGLWDHEYPAWSPDGTTLAYTAFADLWTVSAEGTDPRRLTRNGVLLRFPEWSPDGDHLYFTSFLEGTTAIWRVNETGKDLRRITFGTGPENHPDVSRDGSRLVYATDIDNHDLVLFSPATETVTRLPGVGEEWMPALSPDGKGVVFVSDRYGGKLSLWFQELDGGIPRGAPRRLTDQAGAASHPVVSPDGTRVAYYLIEPDRRNLWVLDLDGGPPRRVTSGVVHDVHPAWSPDGTRLAFSSDREAGTEIWLVDIGEEGTPGSPRRLTDSQSSLIAPVWEPGGEGIACVASGNPTGETLIRIDVADPGEPRTLVRNRRLHRARYAADTGDLWITHWHEGVLRLARLDASGSFVEITDCGASGTAGVFDVTPDGTIVVFAREERKGDIWMLQSTPGTF